MLYSKVNLHHLASHRETTEWPSYCESASALVVKIAAYGAAAVMTASAVAAGAGMKVEAARLSDVLPAAGIGLSLSDGTTLAKIQERKIAEEKQDKNLNLSVSDLKAYLEESRYASRKTVIAASVVKEAEVQQALAAADAEKEAKLQEQTQENVQDKTQQNVQEAAAENIQPVEGSVLMTVAAAGTAGSISTPASAASDSISVLTSTERTEDAVFTEATDGEASGSVSSNITTVLSGAAGTDTSSEENKGNAAEVSDAEIKSVSENNQADNSGNAQNDAQNTDLAEDAETVLKDAEEEKTIEQTQTTAQVVAGKMASMTEEEREFSNLVIAQVNKYVNVRSDASEDSEIVGKLYDKSVGTYISEKDGWYEITSGNVTGYVKAEYCVTGSEAVELAKKVGTRVATVTTTTLKVREEASTDSTVLGLVPIDEELSVVEEADGWVKVDIEEGCGWVSTDYVKLRTDFVKAESKAEEEARLAKEAEERKKAQAAANANSTKPESSNNKNYNSASSYISAGGGSASGNAVAQFALQFKGNPYVYGGSSLTNGTDCSGFVMSVYKNFGVSLPHSSSADRSVGSSVGSLSEAQPGDIVCYSGHVGLYIGDGQIVHASNAKTGIIVSNANYRNILAIRRIF